MRKRAMLAALLLVLASTAIMGIAEQLIPGPGPVLVVLASLSFNLALILILGERDSWFSLLFASIGDAYTTGLGVGSGLSEHGLIARYAVDSVAGAGYFSLELALILLSARLLECCLKKFENLRAYARRVSVLVTGTILWSVVGFNLIALIRHGVL